MNFISEMTRKIAEQQAKDYDEMMFKFLEPYGVTRDNLEQYRGRLEKRHFVSNPNTERIYMDGRYLFTLETDTTIENNGLSHIMKTTYSRIFES